MPPASLNQERATPPLPYNEELYRQRHRIENMLGRLRDWRRIATRYDRCAHAFFGAFSIAAAVTYWLCLRVLILVSLKDSVPC